MGLVAYAMAVNKKLPSYFVYGVEFIYVVLFTWKNKFIYKKSGKIIFILGEAMFMTVFSFFLFKVQWIVDYHLDFLGVAAMLLADIVFYTV